MSGEERQRHITENSLATAQPAPIPVDEAAGGRSPWAHLVANASSRGPGCSGDGGLANSDCPQATSLATVTRESSSYLTDRVSDRSAFETSILPLLGTHVIISKWAGETIKWETDYTVATVRALADHAYRASLHTALLSQFTILPNYNHSPHDLATPISSGSYHIDGMINIVAPCSMWTLTAINAGICDRLIARAADVYLKERRRLVLAVRETPFSEVHLRNMLGVTRAGVTVAPPVVGFYTRPSSIEQVIEQMTGRLLDLFGLDVKDFVGWEDMRKEG
ncbi:flavoprotein [Daldinia sp. FL1419]|nr:flavoprotein [Daldinia sp. FL1419]